MVPEVNAAQEAGALISNLPGLWKQANLTERRKIILSMLDAVYIDPKQTKSVVAIKPKPACRPILQVAVSKKNATIRILNEPLKGSSVFMVETGEARSLPETRYMADFSSDFLKTKTLRVTCSEE